MVVWHWTLLNDNDTFAWDSFGEIYFYILTFISILHLPALYILFIPPNLLNSPPFLIFHIGS